MLDTIDRLRRRASSEFDSRILGAFSRRMGASSEASLTGCPPDRLAWLRVETARKWGRKLYGPRGYRLIPCGAGKCAVYPPTANPDAIPAGGRIDA